MLSESDFVCLPSIERTEAFGLVLLEAAGAGKPALVTRIEGSGMSWVIKDDITGWTAASRSVGDLAKTLERISQTKPELQRRGEEALRRFEEKIQMGVTQAKIFSIYTRAKH